MKVSIVIPVYNLEKELQDCLHSCINQTYTDLEIVVVDDGSNDDSKNIINYFSKNDDRVKAFFQKNAGVNIARENGIKKCTGDYVVFVDGDDTLTSDGIEKLVNIAQTDNADIIVSRFNVVHSQTKECIKSSNIHTISNIEGVDCAFNLLKFGGHQLFGKLYKIKIFKDIVFYNLKSSEDLLVSIQLALNSKKIIFSNEVTYNYMVQRAGSAMTSQVNHRFRHNFLASYEVMVVLKGRELDGQRKRELVNFIANNLFVYLYRSPILKMEHLEKVKGLVNFCFENIKNINSSGIKLAIHLAKFNTVFGSCYVKIIQKYKKTIPDWK
ncbi:glycosyltransferase family 2 protein [Formosa sp. 3Alg 14/1]|uniref:glycosyltransferase family 2 protein n=1 Tax=Formosa sp. 3Alg 14/1 TaxID=3382190 RepID=UPI0039BE94B9